MATTIITTPSARYPYTPSCDCGHQFRGYAAMHAAQLIAEAHRCIDGPAVMAVPIGARIDLPGGALIKASGNWSAETGQRAEAVADPAVDMAAWRAAMGPHESALLSTDGRTVNRHKWCECGPAATVNPVRYQRWSMDGFIAEAYACTSCRCVVQVG
jgi:hypothetical protein